MLMATAVVSPAAVSRATSTSAPAPLAAELEATSTSFLAPCAFFVSWQGVLTLAFSGFTEPLVQLKHRIAAAHPTLPPESPGSKWPKTTLGCLRDGQRLTPEQLSALCAICRWRREEGLQFGARPRRASGAGSSAGIRLAVHSACITIFECRSLERVLSAQSVKFLGGEDAAPPPAEEQARVAAILAEAEAPSYWFAASRDGNREAHYRGPHLGASLVHPLCLSTHSQAGVAGRTAHPAPPGPEEDDLAHRQALLSAIDDFRRRVDEQLPGMYVWFSDASLHITLRALLAP